MDVQVRENDGCESNKCWWEQGLLKVLGTSRVILLGKWITSDTEQQTIE